MTILEMTTPPAEARLSTLGREITALTERLACASEAAVLRSLDAMQTAGMTMPQAIEPRNILAVYHYALSGVPGAGLSAATQKLIRGDYAANPNVLLGTIPKPPVLAALAKAEALGMRAELARKREMVATLTSSRTENRRSAAGRSRVQALLETFRRAHAAAKAGSGRDQPALEPQSEHLHAPALPGASAELAKQRAFREARDAGAADLNPSISEEACDAA